MVKSGFLCHGLRLPFKWGGLTHMIISIQIWAIWHAYMTVWISYVHLYVVSLNCITILECQLLLLEVYQQIIFSCKTTVLRLDPCYLLININRISQLLCEQLSFQDGLICWRICWCILKAYITELVRTPVRQDFHTGYGKFSLWFNELCVIVHRITLKTCRFPYENACRMGVRKLCIHHALRVFKSLHSYKFGSYQVRLIAYVILNFFLFFFFT